MTIGSSKRRGLARRRLLIATGGLLAAPSIVRDWGVPAATLGPVFAAANFGVLLGALFISMLADRIGRRPVIVAAALFVAPFMALRLLVCSGC